MSRPSASLPSLMVQIWALVAWRCIATTLPSGQPEAKEEGSLCLQSLLVIRIFRGLLLDGCFVWSMLQNMYFMVVVICFLKLDFRSVRSFELECFFCILKTRVADDLSEDGDSCSCGSIHQWQVREPLLLIPRSHEQGHFRLGSVLRPQDLQLNSSLPLVHPPARLPEESLALWRACTKGASEDFNCGCVPVRSQLAHHQTPVAVFPVFGLLVTAFIFSSCNGVLVFTPLLKALQSPCLSIYFLLKKT